MSGLLSSLQTASTSLQVFSKALGTEQNNVSNASTPGYAAVRATILPIDLSGNGSSLDFIDLKSTGDSRSDAQVRAVASQAASSSTASSQLASVNQLFDITGASGILNALQQFSTAFANLSVTPNDQTLRSTALAAAGHVAAAFNSVTANLDTQQAQADSAARAVVGQINSLASQIRQYNVQIRGGASANSGVDAGLRSSLDQLSTLVDVSVTTNSDGTVSVLAGGRQPLVIGDQAYTLSADPSAAPGSQITSSGGGVSPPSYSGQLGALLDTRNGTIAQLLGNGSSAGTLNVLAKGFASRVNALVTSGATSSGAPGTPVFSFDSTDDTNVARTIALTSGLTTDQLALATTGVSGQVNGVANQLAALAGSNNPADQIAGLSAQDLFGSIAAGIGQNTSDAANQAASDHTALTSAQTTRQDQSGVSLDQEAVAITGLQRAYEASAKVVSILDQLTSDEVNLIK